VPLEVEDAVVAPVDDEVAVVVSKPVEVLAPVVEVEAVALWPPAPPLFEEPPEHAANVKTPAEPRARATWKRRTRREARCRRMVFRFTRLQPPGKWKSS
jgi:hypothetical protein